MIQVDNEETLKKFNEFAKNRDWQQFHTIKNLTMALSVEVSELVEIFQWANPDEIEEWIKSNSMKRKKIEDELADIYLYFLKIASLSNVNLNEAIERKMQQNTEKYPIEKSKGNAKKYDEL